MTSHVVRTAGVLVLAALAAASARPAGAQSPARMQVLAFSDTASVRVEVELPDAAGLQGAPVRAVIVPSGGGPPLWRGELGRLALRPDGTGWVTGRVEGVRPRLWSPGSPALYEMAVEVGVKRPAVRETVRFGFRRFEAKDGRFLLNGRPLFLRGNAINPPDRTLPDSLSEQRRFAEDYVRHLKGAGVNVIRLTRHSQTWFDVADELGMMIFQGNYGTPEWGEPTRPPDVPFEQSVVWYKDEVFEPLVNHPSVVIYVLSNEQASEEIPYLKTGAKEIEDFLHRVYAAIQPWDPTRPYIGNAGYGFGRVGEVCDLHRYWGWYYNSFLSYYTLRDPRICWRTDAKQPITLTENTGNYTGVDGRFNLVPGTKQPDSQLNWTGHAPESEQASRALAYQAFVAKQAIEITRRLRARNPYLSGLMPFTIPFHDWWGIGSFADMRPKPVMEQYAASYQPVLLSWELWTPQVYAGSTLRPVAHVVNDSETGEELDGLELHYSLVDADGEVRASGRQPLPATPYYAAIGTPLRLELPADLPADDYSLVGRLVRGADTLSTNETPLFVAPRGHAGAPGRLARRVRLHDPSGKTARALSALGVPFQPAGDVGRLSPARDLLIIGAGAWDATLADARERLRAFVAGGGRVLVLRQEPGRFDPSWLPVSVRLQTEPIDHPLLYPGGRPHRNGMAVNPERPDHPVFDGVDRDRLFLWSDWTGWDESRPGFPEVYPVTGGFVLEKPEELGRAAVLANYDHGLEGVALAELFGGRGSAILSGFNLVDRAGLDPVADRMLLNLVRYHASAAPHHAAPLVDGKIVWGDYASERGLVQGIYNGLLLNTVPVVPEGLRERYPVKVDERGFHLAGSAGGWNTRPSIQYVGRGRRPFGPYEFSLGGSVRLPKDHRPEGEGTFWARVPAGRETVATTVWNPAAEPLELEVVVDGASHRAHVPAGETVRVEGTLRATPGAHAITYRGDRRLVVLETEFR